jgi:hypothetical protein
VETATSRLAITKHTFPKFKPRFHINDVSNDDELDSAASVSFDDADKTRKWGLHSVFLLLYLLDSKHDGCRWWHVSDDDDDDAAAAAAAAGNSILEGWTSATTLAKLPSTVVIIQANITLSKPNATSIAAAMVGALFRRTTDVMVIHCGGYVLCESHYDVTDVESSNTEQILDCPFDELRLFSCCDESCGDHIYTPTCCP